jgi:hypothetical protein
MTPPTLAYFIDGLLISICEPPTFTTMSSTDALRWGLIGGLSRSSRNPDRTAGSSGLPLSSFGLARNHDQLRSSFGTSYTIGCGRCPIVQGVEAGEPFPVGFSSLCLLTVCILSQAPRLGGLHRTSRVPFRGSFFTLHSIMQRYAPRAQRLPVQAKGFFIHYTIALRGAH